MIFSWVKKNSLLILVVAILLGISLYSYKTGTSKVLKEWEAETLKHQAAIGKLTKEYAILESIHRNEVIKITGELSDVRTEYESTINSISSTYNDRLQQSEERANIYQRKAQAGTSECRAIADHTARLDRSITEGRELVKQLTATIRLRDSQLELVGSHIQSERKLLQE